MTANLASSATGTDDEHPTPPVGLKAGAVSVVGVTVQSVGLIGPAIGALMTTPFIVSIAGTSGAFAFLIGFLLMLVAAIPLGQLAREIPSAGGYYTYISKTLSARLGFLVSWLWLFYTPVAPAFNLAVLGFILNNTLEAHFGFGFPWWLGIILGAAFLVFMGWRGVELSAKALMILAGAEISIMVTLAIWGLIVPGDGGFSAAPLVPTHAPSANGLLLGIIFSIFAITGWEGAAPAAEETVNPRRNIPRALIASVVVTGVFFVFVTWGLQVGWGVNDAAGFGSSTESPALVLAQKFWGGAWVIVLLALINSVLAVAVASNNVSTRMWYAMARSGSLPQFFAKLHPKFRTPVNAVVLQAILVIIVGIGVGALIGPDNEFFFFGLALTVVMVFVYSLGNIGVVRFFWRRPDRKIITHVILPVVSTVSLLAVGYYSLVPLPAKPIGWAPVAVGIWAVIGVGILVVMRLLKREAWLKRAGDSMAELEPDSAEDHIGPVTDPAK
jgi:amino acid transporter